MIKVPNKLRVHHYPQVPCEPFFVDVKDEEEAYKICNVLAEQHLFLFNNNFISDYSNFISVLILIKSICGFTTNFNRVL